MCHLRPLLLGSVAKGCVLQLGYSFRQLLLQALSLRSRLCGRLLCRFALGLTMQLSPRH